MDLTKILSVTGRPGLFLMITETKNGLIVESLEDGKRFPVFSNVRVSSLEEISIFSTSEEDIAIADIFRAIFKSEEGKVTPDLKSDPDALRDYFSKVVPDYDEDRVYISDIKKVISWYNILAEKEMLEFEEEEQPGESTGDQPEDEKEDQPEDEKQ